MALPNPYPAMKKSSQQGLYPGSGVAQGGNVSRPKRIHMGMPSSAAGGLNAKGTSYKPLPMPAPKLPTLAPLARTAASTTATKPMTPTAVPGRPVAVPHAAAVPTGPSVIGGGTNPTPPGVFKYGTTWYFRNPQGNLAKFTGTAAQLANTTHIAIPHGFTGLTPTVAHVVAPVASAPAPAPVLGDLSTHDPAYLHAIAQADLNYNNAGSDITDLKGQIATNKPLYDLGVYDQNHSSSMDAEQSNAALAARGIFNSGSRVVADTERADALNKAMLQLSEQYGPAAAAALQGRIDAAEAARGVYDPATGHWSGQRGLDYQTAEGDAWQRSMDALQKDPPVAPIAAPAAPAAAPHVAPGPVVYHRDNQGRINLRDSTGRWFYNVHPPTGAKFI